MHSKHQAEVALLQLTGIAVACLFFMTMYWSASQHRSNAVSSVPPHTHIYRPAPSRVFWEI